MARDNGVNDLARQIGEINMADDNQGNRRPMNHSPYISLRDAAETILPFDGKNMPVSQFANSCISAKSMISPNAEYGLVQMIKNKLVGPALRVALSGEYNNLEALLTVLQARFAPVYSSSQLHGELSKVTQYPDETVVDYGSRVSMILQQLKSCYQAETPNQAVQFMNSAETNAIRNFLTGLKTDIYTRIYPRDPGTLNTAIESAIRAETDYTEHSQRMKITEGLMQSIRCNNCLGYGHNTYSCSTINPLAQISHVQWQPKVCTYCKNPGHARAECRALLQPRVPTRNILPNMGIRNPNLGNYRYNRPNYATPRSAGLFCRYCKTPGHSLEQCRKRQYNNNLRNRADDRGNDNRERRDNAQRERGPENPGNRERVQRAGAALNERPRVRLVTPGETCEGTLV